MADRRTTVLDAAITVLGERGARALTHRAVDAEADLPAGSTSNYFRSRDSLLQGVVERFVDRERVNWETVASSVNPRTPATLAQALGAFARQECGPQRTLTLARYALLVEGAQHPSLRSALAVGGSRVNVYFENWLLRIGSVNPDRDMRIVANFLTGRVLHDLAMPDPGFDPTQDLVDLIECLLRPGSDRAGGKHSRLVVEHLTLEGAMDVDEAWQAIDTQRRCLADTLDGLSEDEWRQPSLCAGWTVRDVAAHLTLQQVGVRDLVRDAPTVMRARGLDKAIHDLACRRAELPAPELIEQIRGSIGSRRHNFGVTYRETLVDILVHSQDIAIPLGRRLPMPAAASAVAAQRIWEMKRMFHARERFAHYHLTATDVTWTVGAGREVRGPAGALLLLITGRAAALPLLAGDGMRALGRQFAIPE